MEKKEENQLYKDRRPVAVMLWGSVGVLIALLVICSVVCYTSMKEQLYKERQNHLSELTIKISEIMNMEMKNLQQTADSAKLLMNTESRQVGQTLTEQLEGIRSILGMEKGELLAVNTMSVFYTSGGSYGRWETPEDLVEEDGIPLVRELNIAGEKETYMIFLRALDKDTVFDGDGVALSHILLAIPLSEMEEEFSISGFGGNCYTYLINTSGRRLYKQTFSDVFIEEFNVLSALRDYTFTMDGSVEELEDAIQNQENACLEFELPETGEDYFVSTVPIGDTDWAVLVFVATNVLGKSSGIVMSNLLRYIGVISAILLAIVGLLIYITFRRSRERQLLEQQAENNVLLERAAREATQASLAKSEFLSHMSHDIRTPINGIVGMVSIARKNITDTARIEDCLNKISQSSDHLLSLINDVLEMSRIESGKIEVAHKPINMNSIIESCCSIIDTQRITRNLEFRREIGELTHARLLGDDLRLRQIFINILGNSVKFTPDGGTIVFRVEELGVIGERAAFCFEIEDNGIGMSEEFQEHIFEPFSQESGDSRTNYQGAGLGMSITQQFVEMMGGTIRVKSSPGEGSCFHLEMSFDLDDTQEEELPGAVDCSLEGMRILLVEDNELNREIAQEILEDAGATVTTAEDGREALGLFIDSAPGSFDAILMDVMMPNMNGYEATRAIRASAHSDAASIPIIAMTANAYVEDVAAALESGMNAHVAKPIDISYLFGVLGQYYKAPARSQA